MSLLEKLLAPLGEACDALGITTKTGRNQLSNNTFPIQTVRFGGKRMVVVHDLKRYLAEIGALPAGVVPPAPAPLPNPEKRGPGRPRKIVKTGGAA